MEVQHERKFITDSILNQIVSLFNSATDSKPVWDHQNDRPKWIHLLDLLLAEPGEYGPTIERIRSTNDPEERARLKKQIPAFTPSGLFAHRSKGGLIAHTGLIALDIDAKDNADRLSNYGELKSELAKLPFVAYVGQSVSGTGYFVLIPIKDPTRHKQHFQALEIAFANAGLIVDAACSDVTRLRFWSYDPDAYFNHFAKAWQSEYEPPVIQRTKPTYRTDAGVKTWKAFNEAHNILDVLEGYGWTVLRHRGNEVDLNRPGAKTRGKDAVVFLDSNRLWLETTSDRLPVRTRLSPFDVVKIYEHGGDELATTRALKHNGI